MRPPMSDKEKAQAIVDRLYSIYPTFETALLTSEDVLSKCNYEEIAFFFAKLCEKGE